MSSPSSEPLLQARLPEANISLKINGLGPCSNSADRSIRLNSQEPVTVLVHGCNGSAGRFSTLSDVLAFHGQQSVCFSYDDRQSLMHSSAQLLESIEALEQHLESSDMTVMGHSQGGLVARKALVKGRGNSVSAETDLKLVTISAPLSGIRSARLCSNTALRVGSLGLQDLACWIVSGNKWFEITEASDFIRTPGVLDDSVTSYLLIATDERNTCRKFGTAGKCIEDDFVFTLDEQVLPYEPASEEPKLVQLRAGHVEIVGESGVIPRKLIAVLQEQGYINQTPEGKRALFDSLLKELYSYHANTSSL